MATRTRTSWRGVDAHRQRYVPQFAPADVQAKQTPYYLHRLTGGLVQQGLSVAGDDRDSNQFGSATDKRYSLGNISMMLLNGTVSSGCGVAAHNLAACLGLIEQRMGLAHLVPGTFNVKLPESYIVIPNALIHCHEYNGSEFLKLQRCRIGGARAIIMRPNTHEAGYAHGPTHLELMSNVQLREFLGVANDDSVSVEVEGDEIWWTGDDA